MINAESGSSLHVLSFIEQPKKLKVFTVCLFLFLEVTVILGGESDAFLETAVDTVETYSPNCGIFNASLPPIPVARKLLAATYLDGS